ncbi:MAG: class I SAM-dependent methyltransferase [Limisphaerales bacterium]
MTVEAAASAPITRACPLCGRADAVPFLDKRELHLVRCRRCGMVYATPVEPELASGSFYDRLAVPFYLSPDKLESDYAPVRFARELRLFRRRCQGGKVLDVGCSTGAFLYQLKARYPADYEVVGTDVAGAALEHAAGRGVPVVRGSFLEHDFGASRFDAVTFWAVIEHLVEPKRFLEKAAGVLKPGGLCFLLVPNLGSLAVRLLGAKYRYIMPDHVNYFSSAALKQFAAVEEMFEIVEAGSSHFNPLVILRDFRGGAERVPDGARARLLKRTTAYKQNPWLRPAKWLYGGLETVLATLGLADNLFIVVRKK